MRRPLLLALAALLLAACADAPSPDETPKAPAKAAAPASTPASTPAARPEMPKDAAHSGLVPAPPPMTATQPVVRPSEAFVANGTSSLRLELGAPFELAGFEVHLAFEGGDFRAAQPEITGQLQGFLCAANPDLAGSFKYICASVPARRAEGLLATVPISWRERPPVLSDLRVEKIAVVDVDSNPAPAGVELRLTIVD